VAGALKVLMVGMGGVGQRHARNLRTLLGSGVTLSAYRTRPAAPVISERMQIESGADMASSHQLTEFTDLDAALADRPDVVVISNPTSLHISTALTAARAGCHLFLEKPISHNLQGVRELLEILHEKKLVAFVGHQLRFHPLLLKLKELLGEERIGRVIAVRAEFGEYLPNWHPYEDYRQSYAARRELGGGVILSQIHDFDYLMWLFGLPHQLLCVGGKLSDLEIDVEDTASTLMSCRYQGRTIPIHLHQDLCRKVSRRSCQVIGDKGEITADIANGILQVVGADGQIEVTNSFSTLERNQLFLDAMKHFLSCLHSGATPCVSARDGANGLSVALAALNSMQTGLPSEVIPL
jgi:predicted dehydrogenase